MKLLFAGFLGLLLNAASLRVALTMFSRTLLKEKEDESRTMKQISQELEDGLTTEVFNEEVAKRTALEGSTRLQETTKKRLSYLARIPFKAIVTTNFNNLLDGFPSGGTATSLNPQHIYETILRPVPGEARARAVPSLRW